MESESTTFVDRFSGRSDSYAKYRPRYPIGIIKILESEIGFDASKVVADVGSGTGLLAEVFLQNGNTVVGVEPNAEMRQAGRAYLSTFRNFASANGSAEKTGLESHSFDLVAVGQALHWFDLEKSSREFRRILNDRRHVAIVYNERTDRQGLMRDYKALVDKHERNRARVPEIDDSYLSRFFGGAERFRKFALPNSQRLDLEGLLGRASSSSYMPKLGEPSYKELQGDLEHLFQVHQRNGIVEFEYETSLIVGSLPSLPS